MKIRRRYLATFAALLVSGCIENLNQAGVASTTRSLLGPLFDSDLATHDVIIIGETHGTKEIPFTIAALSDQLGARTLFALELRPESASMTCPPEEFAISWGRAGADGRSSKAMLAALCKIRANAKRHDSEFLLIDDRSATQRTFYDSAAAAISEKLDSGKFDNAIVLTGNFHARNGEGHLAAALATRGKRVVTATASAPSGSAWQCKDSGCGEHKISLKFCEDTGGDQPNWTADVPAGRRWDRCITFPTLTASYPADETPTPEA